MSFKLDTDYPPRCGPDERRWREPYSVFTNSDGRLMMVDPTEETPVLIPDPTYDLIGYRLFETTVGEGKTAFVMGGPQGLRGFEIFHSTLQVVPIHARFEHGMLLAYAGDRLYTEREMNLVCLNVEGIAPVGILTGRVHPKDPQNFRVHMVSIGNEIFIWFENKYRQLVTRYIQFVFDGTKVQELYGNRKLWCNVYYSRVSFVVYATTESDPGMWISTISKDAEGFWECESTHYDSPGDQQILTNTCFGPIMHDFTDRKVSCLTKE